MKNKVIIGLLMMLLSISATAFAGGHTSSTIKCSMDFTLKGWSIFYKTAEGTGQVTCSNGQQADVKINFVGGGFSFGNMEILDGIGTFYEVTNINEIFGGYVAAEAHAGAGKSTQVSVYTKGNISLKLTGTGRGINVGFDFGRLEILK
jgi:hypothetical protein